MLNIFVPATSGSHFDQDFTHVRVSGDTDVMDVLLWEDTFDDQITYMYILAIPRWVSK